MAANDLRMCGIISEDVDQIWPQIEDILQTAVEYSDGKYRISDIYHALIERDMQLWIIVDDKNHIYSAIVTQVVTYPRKKVMFVMLVAGVKFNEWSALITNLTDFAKAHGCETIEGYGREGWEVKLKRIGFAKIHTVYSLSLWGNDHAKDMD